MEKPKTQVQPCWAGRPVVVGHEQGLHARVRIDPHMRLEAFGQRMHDRDLRFTAPHGRLSIYLTEE